MTNRDIDLLLVTTISCGLGVVIGEVGGQIYFNELAINAAQTHQQAEPYPDDLRYNPHEYRVTPVPPKDMEETP